MKTLKNILLSAMLTVFVSAPALAGSVSMSGSMEISGTTGLSGGNNGGKLGQENELSVTASTELDGGTTVSYKQSITQDNARNDSELVFGTAYGKLAMTSTGTPVDAIDNIVPSAFEEAFHGATTWTSVGTNDGTFGIRFTNADLIPGGYTVDVMYQPRQGAGDAANDEGGSGTSNADYGDVMEYVLKGPIPLIDGANMAIGYSEAASSVGTEHDDKYEATAAITYAYGPISVGAQKGLINYQLKSDQGTNWIKNTYYGIAYAVNDNLSLSYQNNTSYKHTRKAGGGTAADGSQGEGVEQESEGLSIAYTIGGMKIAYVDNSHDNESYGSVSKDYRQVVLGVAF